MDVLELFIHICDVVVVVVVVVAVLIYLFTTKHKKSISDNVTFHLRCFKIRATDRTFVANVLHRSLLLCVNVNQVHTSS